MALSLDQLVVFDEFGHEVLVEHSRPGQRQLSRWSLQGGRFSAGACVAGGGVERGDCGHACADGRGDALAHATIHGIESRYLRPRLRTATPNECTRLCAERFAKGLPV